MTTPSSGVIAPTESQGPLPGVAAVPTGSLPVSSVRKLLHKWRSEAKQLREQAAVFETSGTFEVAYSLRSAAQAREACEKNLCAEVDAAMMRQPEENP